MATNNPEFDIESTLDLDNLDTAAGQRLVENTLGKPKDEIEVVQVEDPRVAPVDRTTKPLADDDNPEPTEEELAAYSEGVRKRIEKLTHARHDERRSREQAQRERDEAVSFAQQALAQKNQYEQHARRLAEQSATSNLGKIDSELAQAKKAYVDAANSYDTEAMAEAQLKMSTLAAQKERLEARKAEQALAPIAQPVVQPQPSAQRAPDSRAQDWAARNSAWFQKDKAMTAFAFGVHEDLVSKGVDPRTDAELYYSKLDEQVKKRFPEQFESTTQRSAANTRQSSPVASASRVVNGRRRVTLTTTEVATARRLGVTPEMYAAEKLKLEPR